MSNPAITTSVYVTPAGKSYHTVNDCAEMGKHTTQRVEVWSLKKALAYHRRPCRLCPTVDPR
ncbi:hypothetical protein SNOUR_20255 [Streptomyces noursei ATCC 11455]|nr:hypothetical protein SNOUR_20255 [Streptomyces noursei ATCC 11455]